MHPILTRALDRLIIHSAARRMPAAGRHQAHSAEAAALLSEPDFFCDFVQIPRDMEWESEKAFQFQSQIVTPWERNNRVRGNFFPCSNNWRNAPTTLLLHGWNDELGYQFRFPYIASQLKRRKVNTVTIQLPYHLQRRPSGPGAITNFISEDLWRMVEATRQSIADVRALVKWFHAQGRGPIGLWGTSLGAWLTGLIACHEPQIDFAVLTTPVAKLDRVINELAFCEPIRRSYEESKIDLAKLNLLTHQPKTPRDKILLQEAEDDLFAPKEAIEEVWSAWNKPEIWRLRHGHISVLMSVPVMNRTVDWIAAKANGGR